MGHDDRGTARGQQARQHVLDKHEVGLLAGLRGEAVGEAILPLAAGEGVVLGEWRIGEDTVELAELAVLDVQGILQRVAVLDVRVGEIVKDEVHLRDGNHRAIVFLAVQFEVVAVAALFA